MIGEYVEVPDITTPKQGYKVVISQWWLTRNGNPLMYVAKDGAYPQCHMFESTVDIWLRTRSIENAGKKFLPLAFIPINKE